MEQWPEIRKRLSYKGRNKDRPVNMCLNWGKADFNIMRQYPANVDGSSYLQVNQNLETYFKFRRESTGPITFGWSEGQVWQVQGTLEVKGHLTHTLTLSHALSHTHSHTQLHNLTHSHINSGKHSHTFTNTHSGLHRNLTVANYRTPFYFKM